MIKNLFNKQRSRLTLLASALLIASTTVCAAAEEATSEMNVSREYHLKAAFLRYVAKFVTWPGDFEPEDGIYICTYGEVPSLKGMNSINGRLVKEKPLIVRPVVKLEQSKTCQIFYVLKSKEDQANSVITTLKGTPVLAFGDMEGFAEDGGAMNFYIVNNRMAIMINQHTIAESNLTIAPRMLKLVTIVPGQQGQEQQETEEDDEAA